MRAFALLLDRLASAPGAEARVRHLARYLEATTPTAREPALALLAGELTLPRLAPAALRALAAGRTDPELLRLSLAFSGDLAETVALLWEPVAPEDHALAEVLGILRCAGRASLREVLAGLLDRLGAPERVALLRLVTGRGPAPCVALVSAALARLAGESPETIAELWHGLPRPRTALLAFVFAAGPRPLPAPGPRFRPMPRAAAAGAYPDPEGHHAEWDWDGLRVQASSEGVERRLWSGTGLDLSAGFVPLLAALPPACVLDGALVPAAPVAAEPLRRFRAALDRGRVPSRAPVPVVLRVWDLIAENGEDLRALPLALRRARLEALAPRLPQGLLDLSPLLAAPDPDALAGLASATPADARGVVVKPRAGTWTGLPGPGWLRIAAAGGTVAAVALTAEPGPDGWAMTVGLADGAGGFAPLGRAAPALGAAERAALDRFVRANTVERFGPVRALAIGLVVTVAFARVIAAPRRRAGLALDGARLVALRPDLATASAAPLATLRARLRD